MDHFRNRSPGLNAFIDPLPILSVKSEQHPMYDNLPSVSGRLQNFTSSMNQIGSPCLILLDKQGVIYFLQYIF